MERGTGELELPLSQRPPQSLESQHWDSQWKERVFAPNVLPGELDGADPQGCSGGEEGMAGHSLKVPGV